MSHPTTQTNDQGVELWGPNEVIIPDLVSRDAAAALPGDGDHGRYEYKDRNHIQDQQESINSSNVSDTTPTILPEHVVHETTQSTKRFKNIDDLESTADKTRRRYRSESCSPEVTNRTQPPIKEGDPPTPTFRSPTRSLMDSRASFGAAFRPRTRSNPKPNIRTWKDSDRDLVSEEESSAPQTILAGGKSSSLESPSKGHSSQLPVKATSKSLEERTQQNSASTRLAQEVIGKDHKILSSKEREVMLKEISGQQSGSFAALDEPVPEARPTTLRQRRLMFSHLTASVDVDTREKPPSTPPYLPSALATSEDMLLSEVLQASQPASSLEQLTGVARKALRRRGLIPLEAFQTSPSGHR